MPYIRRKEGGMSQKIYSRRKLIMAAEEEVYDGFIKWKYDTVRQVVGSAHYWCEPGWCYINNPSNGKIRWFGTNYTGRHKTLDVKEGQRYKIKAGQLSTQIVFCNDHTFAAGQVRDAYCISIQAGQEHLITVPAGWQYMMIWFYQSSGANIRHPERVARLKAYG